MARHKGDKNLGLTKRERMIAESDLSVALATLSQIADMDPAPGFNLTGDQLALWAKNNARATYERLTKES